MQDRQQLLIIEPSLTRVPVAPGIVAAARYPELAAQRRHRAAAFVLGDEPEAAYFFFGKIRSAFFNITFSSRNAFSWRSNVRIFALASSNSFRERASCSLS